MINIEVVLNNGQKNKINYEGNAVDFMEVVKYDNGNSFIKDEQGYYILVKNIMVFKFNGENQSE